jgi:hypothetical protein
MVNQTKSEILGKTLYIGGLIIYLVGLIYLLYFGKYQVNNWQNLFSPSLSSQSLAIIVCLACLGLIVVSILYQTILEEAFYPNSKEEIELKQKIKRIWETLPKKKARIEIKRQRLLFKLKELKCQ